MRDYRIDTDMFKRFEEESRKRRGFEPYMMLKGKHGSPYLVQVSNEPNPARWMVIGIFFDATFLTYQQLKDFIHDRALEVWTEADDEKFGMKCSAYCKTHNRIF